MPSGRTSKKGKQSAAAHADAAPSVQTGVYVFPDGAKYDGEYAEPSSGQIQRKGMGTHYSTNGMVYTGQWANDKMNGQGELRHPAGAVFKGEFVDGEYHGSGTYTWTDGSSYTGSFSHNKIEGKGEFTDSSGRVWIGTFGGNTATGLRLKLS